MSLALRFKQGKLSGSNAVSNTVSPTLVVDRPREPILSADKFLVLKNNLSVVLATLKRLSGDEERLPYKQQLIEQYREYALHIMASCEKWGNQDVLAFWLIWRLDVEGFEQVQDDWYTAAMRGLTTPSSFNRDWHSLYLSSLFDFYSLAYNQEQFDVNMSFLDKAMEDISIGNLTAAPEMKALIYKIYGHLMAGKDADTAIKAYEKALLLDANCGVKTRLDALKKSVNKDAGDVA